MGEGNRFAHHSPHKRGAQLGIGFSQTAEKPKAPDLLGPYLVWAGAHPKGMVCPPALTPSLKIIGNKLRQFNV